MLWIATNPLWDVSHAGRHRVERWGVTRNEDIGFSDAEEGCTYVITRYRDATQNLRTTFQKIIERAGLNPWPKLFQNLRSTRETELSNEFPLHVATAWIGNSQLVAARYYLQVTDDHFGAATRSQVGHQVGQKASEMTRNGEPPLDGTGAETPVFRGSSRSDANPDAEEMGDTGLEPVTSTL